MGLPMDDIHTPTVPSGPTTNSQAQNVSLSALSPMDLVSRKDRLEEELKALGGVLDSVGID
jgi:26S proteasome regulatory subunit N4